MENNPAESLLELEGVVVEYNRFRALHGVSLDCRAGEIVALLGPNGAGKSTVLKAAFGLLPAAAGTVKWRGQTLKPAPPAMVQAGLSYVPQGRSVFPALSVKENLETAVHFISDTRDIRGRIDEVLALFPDLEAKWRVPAGTLSGGQQQMAVLARGLMTRPRLLLLDEPSLGLSPRLVADVFSRIREINQRLGTAFLIVEHNLKSLLGITGRVCVLKAGRVAASGPTADPALRETIANIFRL